MAVLETTKTRDHGDVAAYFDAAAAEYREQHGDADRLLRERLDLLRQAARIEGGEEVLEIGCGTGLHLLALAGEIAGGLGLDLSPAMVDAARARAAEHPHGERLRFAVGAAEGLESVDSESFDVVLCVGALEHMLNQGAALRSARRVLRPGGRLACLTLNGGSLWYRLVAPALGIATRRLATDRYLDRRQLRRLAEDAGFAEVHIDSWTFVQRGDMPAVLARLFAGLDRLGAATGMDFLRGGLRLAAVRATPEPGSGAGPQDSRSRRP